MTLLDIRNELRINGRGQAPVQMFPHPVFQADPGRLGGSGNLRTAARLEEVWLAKPTAGAELPFDGVTMQAAVHRCFPWCAGPLAPHKIVARRWQRGGETSERAMNRGGAGQ
jgi:hypothetical protein